MATLKKNSKLVTAVIVLAVIALIIIISQQPASYADKDKLTASITDLKTCTVDNDCVLTSSGVCDPGCPIAINSKYKALWESTPDSKTFENQCAVVGACAFRDKSWSAFCQNNTCVALVGT